MTDDGEIAQGCDLPLDAHLHTNLSPDSDVAIDLYARQAIERGISEIAITDHVDFEPGAPAFDFVPFAPQLVATEETVSTPGSEIE